VREVLSRFALLATVFRWFFSPSPFRKSVAHVLHQGMDQPLDA